MPKKDKRVFMFHNCPQSKSLKSSVMTLFSFKLKNNFYVSKGCVNDHRVFSPKSK